MNQTRKRQPKVAVLVGFTRPVYSSLPTFQMPQNVWEWDSRAVEDLAGRTDWPNDMHVFVHSGVSSSTKNALGRRFGWIKVREVTGLPVLARTLSSDCRFISAELAWRIAAFLTPRTATVTARNFRIDRKIGLRHPVGSLSRWLQGWRNFI